MHSAASLDGKDGAALFREASARLSRPWPPGAFDLTGKRSRHLASQDLDFAMLFALQFNMLLCYVIFVQYDMILHI